VCEILNMSEMSDSFSGDLPNDRRKVQRTEGLPLCLKRKRI
jgi:hypothetical protein